MGFISAMVGGAKMAAKGTKAAYNFLKPSHLKEMYENATDSASNLKDKIVKIGNDITHPLDTFKNILSEKTNKDFAKSVYDDTEILDDSITKVSGYTKSTYDGMMEFHKNNDFDDCEKVIKNYEKSHKKDKALSKMDEKIADTVVESFRKKKSYQTTKDKLAELDAEYPGAISYILNSNYLGKNHNGLKASSIRKDMWSYAYEHHYVDSEEPTKGTDNTVTFTVASAAAMMNITAQHYASQFEYSDSLEVLDNEKNTDVVKEYTGKMNEMLEVFEKQGLDLDKIQAESEKLAVYTAGKSASEIDDISPGDGDMDLKIAEVTKGMLTTTTAGSLVENRSIDTDKAIQIAAGDSDSIFNKIKVAFIKKSEALYNFLDSKDKNFFLTDKIHKSVMKGKNELVAREAMSEIADTTKHDVYKKRVLALSELNVDDEDTSDVEFGA